MGPAAMNGPSPGMANPPTPASKPSVPPIAPPAVTPVAVPSGAFVCFSCANCSELWLSGNRTEISSYENPEALYNPPPSLPD